MKAIEVEDRLLATHITNNPEFEPACASGNLDQIMAIVNTEMEKNNLYTKGAKKLRDQIFGLTRGKGSFVHIGSDILFFVWNSRMSGTGFAVC